MCGIAGIVGPGAAAAGPVLVAALDALGHRGPDDRAVMAGAGCLVGHQRLAVRGASGADVAGRQPVLSTDGRVQLTGVGEIYNIDLVRGLPGVRATPPPGDMGTLLAAYLHCGVAGLANIDGEFACAIWDARQEMLVLARDMVGTKPLFYSVVGEDLYFASEIKALAALGVPLRVDAATVDAYLRFNYPLPPRTFYQDVWSVPAGAALLWRNGQGVVEPFADVGALAIASVGQAAPDHDEIKHVLTTAARTRLASDVPLGFHLSGGVDSSLLCTLAALPETPAYTLEYRTNRAGSSTRGDRWWATQVASQLRLQHRVVDVTEEKALATIDTLATVLDSPIMSPGAITPYMVAEQARHDGVTVLVAGQGSDEVFLGYERYTRLAGSADADPAEVAANVSMSDLVRVAPSRAEAFKATDAQFRHLAAPSSDLSSLVAFQVGYLRSFLHEILRLEDHTHMAHSVENRPPYLSQAVLKVGLQLAAAGGAGALGKPALRKVLADRGSVAATRAEKQQMSLPLDVTAAWARRVLSAPDALDALGFCHPDAIRALLNAPTSRSRQRLLWALANLVRWSATFGFELR